MTGPTDITIFEMTPDDLEGVLAIEAESFPAPWTKEHFTAEIDSPLSFPLVAEDQRKVVIGYVCPMVVIDEGHILNVAVHRDCRGLGVGRLLVETALRECLRRGAAFVSLEVRPSNTTARQLYQRLGFVNIGRRKNYYENGEDALIMEYDFGRDEDDAV